MQRRKDERNVEFILLVTNEGERNILTSPLSFESKAFGFYDLKF